MRPREILPPGTRLAFPALRVLRPGVGDERTFTRRVDEIQRAEGYRLVGIFGHDRECALAVAGFRVAHRLASGRFLYVDDLATLAEARRRGCGRMLLEWLIGEGRRLGCDELHLDSGVGPGRADAHRLYLNSGLRITSHHFAMPVAG